MLRWYFIIRRTCFTWKTYTYRVVIYFFYLIRPVLSLLVFVFIYIYSYMYMYNFYLGTRPERIDERINWRVYYPRTAQPSCDDSMLPQKLIRTLSESLVGGICLSSHIFKSIRDRLNSDRSLHQKVNDILNIEQKDFMNFYSDSIYIGSFIINLKFLIYLYYFYLKDTHDE